MNSPELVDAVAAKTNITKKQALEVISAFLSVVTEAVANGEKVTLIGFGSSLATRSRSVPFVKRLRQEKVSLLA